jgi:hypothetical protein
MSALFSPIEVKGVRFKNRVAMPPMVTLKADAEGCVTDVILEHYAARARAGAIQVNPERFPPAEVLDSLDRLRERAAELERGKVSLVHALAAAVDIEEEVLERSYFEVVEADGAELAELLRTLDTETRTHREKLGTAWEQARRRSDRQPQS